MATCARKMKVRCQSCGSSSHLPYLWVLGLPPQEPLSVATVQAFGQSGLVTVRYHRNNTVGLFCSKQVHLFQRKFLAFMKVVPQNLPRTWLCWSYYLLGKDDETCWYKLRMPFSVGMEPCFLVMFYHLSAAWMPLHVKKIWLTSLHCLSLPWPADEPPLPSCLLTYPLHPVGWRRESEGQNWEKMLA